MLEKMIESVAGELKLQPRQVMAVAVLLEEGSTVPFIARYRKELTGSLDEVAVMAVRDRMEQLKELHSRRESVLKSLGERGLLTDALKVSIGAAATLAKLEDIYLPFRPKKRTKATIARELGLEPLAELIWEQNPAANPEGEAAAYVGRETEYETKKSKIETVADALAGARDILAERISEDANARSKLREFFWSDGTISSKVLTGKETEAAKFKDYFEWSEPVKNSPSHRALAMRRGETEGFLLVRIQPPEDQAIQILERLYVKGSSAASQQMKLTVDEAYKRLLKFSMEGETRLALKKKADLEAIIVFADNMRELLLASPLGEKKLMAIDPGFRTGCKTVILDAQGKLLHNDVIYPETGRAAEAAEKVRAFVKHFEIEAIAIGNGTAGRETEAFVRGLGLPPSVQILMVNESGASVYSASEVAREEFPDHDLTVRGAVSIGRRLCDPLAELVKIDPKAIGVGQYQHDVDQNQLKRALDDTVMSCVNAVGVELNTASAQLLSYVSGLNSQIAANIIAYRNENGAFKTRDELKNVPRLGPKAYEQAAGFLRIRGAANPLDSSAVHPERYSTVEKMATDVGCSVPDLIRDEPVRKRIDLHRYVSGEVGLPTLQDIIAELAKPGRDPRKRFEAFSFAEGVSKPQDLKPGMKVPGIVTNVTNFGAFVDIGVHQDGLVHISQLSDNFVNAPADVVKVGQKVDATVIEIDMERKRIALSMKSNPDLSGGSRGSRGTPEPKRDFQPKKPGQGGGGFGGDWFSQAMANAQPTKKK